MGTERKENQQTDSFASTRPGFRMSCQMAASKSGNIFHIDLKAAFLQGQSYCVNDAPRRWWNIHDKALCSCGMVPSRAEFVG